MSDKTKTGAVRLLVQLGPRVERRPGKPKTAQLDYLLTVIKVPKRDDAVVVARFDLRAAQRIVNDRTFGE